MNLYDMFRRKDKNLLFGGDVSLAKVSVQGEVWRGLHIGTDAWIRIPDVFRFHNFRAWPDFCGWFSHASGQDSIRIRIIQAEGGDVVGERSFFGESQPVFLPWPKGVVGRFDLLVERKGRGKSPVTLAVHRALSRQWLYDHANGTGIEIGPGPQPQILPTDHVNVSYLEQMPPAEWNKLYNGGGKYQVRPELWDNYIVGEASDLPVADNSLDFIFSSHVFEHLANPIGHLARWAKKLVSGGRILSVVPDLGGTKDAIQFPSTLQEWLNEFREEMWLPSEHHYSRHLKCLPGDQKVIAAMARMESIHVHYYNNVNCQILLDFAVRRLGYTSYTIEHTANHKDFHFQLIAA
jgi:predicted SAM-dependent methyltransferase